MCFTIIHTISGNLQNNDYQKKESVRDEWALSAIGCFVLSPVAISCLVAMNLLKLTSEVVRIGNLLLIRINHLQQTVVAVVSPLRHIGCYHEELPIAKATVSQHLSALKDAGLIQGEIETPKVKYCMNRENWAYAQQLFSEFFNMELCEKKEDCCK